MESNALWPGRKVGPGWQWQSAWVFYLGFHLQSVVGLLAHFLVLLEPGFHGGDQAGWRVPGKQWRMVSQDALEWSMSRALMGKRVLGTLYPGEEAGLLRWMGGTQELEDLCYLLVGPFCNSIKLWMVAGRKAERDAC